MRFKSWHPLLITGVACAASFHLYQASMPAQAEPTKPPVLGQIAKSEVPAADRFDGPRIQVALLLDTSNSMDGLINQAKSQLWNIVKELAKADVGGKTPRFEVALYEYGNDNLSVTKNYVRQVLPFTTDLDRVSEELNRLKTNGGEEYCGAAIRDSLQELEWSKRDNDMMAVFIAGNEPFDQGGVSFKESCAAARQKNVVVNTIFCGPKAEGQRTQWEAGASLAAGRFFCIDSDRTVAEVSTPYDQDLAQLSTKLNSTYIAYGDDAGVGQARQMAADSAAPPGASGGYVASRAQAKATASYSNESWDLVDAEKKGKVKLENVKPEALPAELRDKSVAERKEYVAGKAAERSKIQEEIRKTGEKRDKFLEEQRAKNNPTELSLEGAILGAIREQAKERGFQFK